jgi:hypothetical protein
MDRTAEIALARSAAPPGVSAAARVLVLTDTGYIVADSGRTGVVCLVDRSWRHSLEPHCYDAEGAATILPIAVFRGVERHRGRAEAEIQREVIAGLASGRFRLPRRPSLTYMLSSAQVLYNDEGKRVGAWLPHVMLYYPGLTNAELGLGTAPDLRVGVVSDEGTPLATLMIVVPQSIEPLPVVRR